MSMAWCLSKEGFKSYAGERVQPLSVSRNEWLRKWSSQLPIQMLYATRLYSSSRFFSASIQLPTMNSTMSKYPFPDEPSVPSSKPKRDIDDAMCIRLSPSRSNLFDKSIESPFFVSTVCVSATKMPHSAAIRCAKCSHFPLSISSEIDGNLAIY